MVKVNKFVPGSVKVLYTVGWLTDGDVLTSTIVRNCFILLEDNCTVNQFNCSFIKMDDLNLMIVNNYIFNITQQYEHLNEGIK